MYADKAKEDQKKSGFLHIIRCYLAFLICVHLRHLRITLPFLDVIATPPAVRVRGTRVTLIALPVPANGPILWSPAVEPDG
jgi:hypothetical protein